jgi:hypothetical protein
MGGSRITMLHLSFAFVWTGQYQFHFLTFQGQSMTARLQSSVTFMENWSQFITLYEASAVLPRRLGR